VNEMSVYAYMIVVRPGLTEHEGFDPEKLRVKIAKILAATLDGVEISGVGSMGHQ
jgi:hypothetical protein